MNNIEEGFVISIANTKTQKLKRIVVIGEKSGVVSSYVINSKDTKDLINGVKINFRLINKDNSSLNTIEFTVKENFLTLLFFKKNNLFLFDSMVACLNNIFVYQTDIQNIYKSFKNTVQSLKYDNFQHTLYCYIDFLLNILAFFGINITFTNYYSDNEPIYYISTKTGNCVSKSKGDPFQKQLFIIPQQFLNFTLDKQSYESIIKIIKFFLKRTLSEHDIYIKNFDNIFFKY